jgi:hypothetical protein
MQTIFNLCYGYGMIVIGPVDGVGHRWFAKSASWLSKLLFRNGNIGHT